MEGANTLHLLHDFNDFNVGVLFYNYYVRVILLIYFVKSVSEGPYKCLLTLSQVVNHFVNIYCFCSYVTLSDLFANKRK